MTDRIEDLLARELWDIENDLERLIEARVEMDNSVRCSGPAYDFIVRQIDKANAEYLECRRVYRIAYPN
jgi:hypothetical protein